LVLMGAASSARPTPTPDKGYSITVDESVAPWSCASESEVTSTAAEAPSRRASAPAGTAGDRRASAGARRASGGTGGGGSKWAGARGAVRGARAFGQAGSALAARRADVRDVGRNGWIARHCVLGPRTHRTVDRFDPIRIIGRGVAHRVGLNYHTPRQFRGELPSACAGHGRGVAGAVSKGRNLCGAQSSLEGLCRQA